MFKKLICYFCFHKWTSAAERAVRFEIPKGVSEKQKLKYCCNYCEMYCERCGEVYEFSKDFTNNVMNGYENNTNK